MQVYETSDGGSIPSGRTISPAAFAPHLPRNSRIQPGSFAMDIKRLYVTQEQVTFTHFANGEFWYQTACGFAFPVPLSDIGTATLLASDKATLFVRYIRKHLAMLEQAKNEAAAVAAA